MRHTKLIDYIAIVGYQVNQDETVKRDKTINQDGIVDQRVQITRSITSSILIHGFGVCSGSVESPISYAFKLAKSEGGTTRLITEQEVSFEQRHYCDILELVQDPIQKHELISDVCIGGVLVTSEYATHHLANCFIEKNKPVIAIEQLVDVDNLPQPVLIESNFERAIEHLLALELAS